MSKKIGLRSFYIANALLACFNILLIVLWVSNSLESSKATESLRKGAALLGMEPYCARGPFAILVDKDFPRKRNFDFVENGRLLSLSAEDIDRSDAEVATSVSVGLGTDLAISFVYSLGNGTHEQDLQVQELMVLKSNQSFVDINVDGCFDTRLNSASIPRHEIWFEGKWREVVDGHEGRKYQMELQGGEVVAFDQKSGLWLLRRDNPKDGRGDITD